jgi:hypothetical protein
MSSGIYATANTEVYSINVLMTASMRFLSLSLFFVIVIDNISLSNGTTIQRTISEIYGTSNFAYAQQQQTVLFTAKNQQWVDKQSNTKVLFTYSPEAPLVGAFTNLTFNIVDLKSGTAYRDVFVRVTILDGQQQQQQQQKQVPLKFYNTTAPNGHLSIKHKFVHDGMYQIIVKVNSKDSALTLASFKMIVPFQPFGVININHIFPLLVPAILAAIVGAVAILLFMVVANKKK